MRNDLHQRYQKRTSVLRFAMLVARQGEILFHYGDDAQRLKRFTDEDRRQKFADCCQTLLDAASL